jgi:hypothetical protein
VKEGTPTGETDRKGRLVISFDVELAWGAIESERWAGREASGVYEQTRTAIRELLAALDAYEITATFAIVGGMLETPGKWTLDHLPEPARDRTWKALCSSDQRSFSGPDILEMIAGTKVNHPIASHSYSHTRFHHPGVSGEFVADDLRHFWRVLPEDVYAAPALVFPQNEEGFYPEVRNSGFYAIRGRDPEPAGHFGWQRRLHSLFATPALSEITDVGNGLWRNTGTVQFISGHRRRLFMVERLARIGLARAVHEGGTMHMWNHPFNFAETPNLLAAFIRILRVAAKFRDRGLLSVGAMETGQ